MSAEREKRRLRKAIGEAIKHFPEGYVVVLIAKPPMSEDTGYMSNLESKVDLHTVVNGLVENLKKDIAQ